MWKIGIVGYFSNLTSLWRLSDAIFYMLASFVIILWHFTTKILKPSIIIACKWLIPLFNIFMWWQIRNFNYFLHWRNFYVIMTSFDVIFAILTSFLEKLKLMLHQHRMPLFNTFWVWKIRLFNNYSNWMSLWRHLHHFCHLDVIFFKRMKRMIH